MIRAPLAGISVLDISDTVAGQFCGRLFADNGADVVLGEPESGSPTRHQGPYAAIANGQLQSCLFWHLNGGKQSVVIDLGSPAGCTDLVALAATVDVVIGDSAGRARSLLDEAARPAVLCDITPFGRNGPWRDWRGGELIYQALSGVMFENGSPDREPLFGVGHRASYAAGSIAYTQSIAALLACSAELRIVDVSVAEVAASMSFNRATQFSYNRVIEDRDPRTIPRALVRCADGWISLFIYDHRWEQSCIALGFDDLLGDERFVDEETRLANWDDFLVELGDRMRDRKVEEVVSAGQKEKVVVARATSPLELRSDPQLLARGYWEWSDPEQLPRLGPMFRFAATPQVKRGGAPATPVRGHFDPPRRRGLNRPRSATLMERSRPLEGVRVFDLTTAWSGPLSTRVLAALGADVLKIEGPGRPDDWRGPVGGGLPSRYPDRAAGRRPFDRCYQFNTQNHDKRSVVLDLKSEAGREIALRLAAQSDIMIANFSAGTLDRMGLGWSVVHALNPRLILVEMPAYGSIGPIANHVALGPSMELMSGMASLIGYGDGQPVTTGPAYLDPIGGFNAAAAVVTALAAREVTGGGQHVELPQREAAMHWIGEEIIRAIATGEDRTPRGNRLPDMAPHGAFPCLGFDEWVVIAARSDAEFHTLCHELGMPELGNDLAFSTAAARKANEDELETRIAGWTRMRSKHEVAATLQSAGVPAAPVCNAGDLLESHFLRARGLLQVISHPAAETHVYQGVPLHISGWDLSIRTPAPQYGEHTEEVLRDRLDLSEGEILNLRATGVIAVEPRGAPTGVSKRDEIAVEPAEVVGSQGVRLRIRMAGSHYAPPILFIHDWSQSAHCWKRQFAKPLVDEFRLVAVDLRGHGMSECPSELDAYTRRQVWADDVAAVIEQLGLDRPLLVGWSFGGHVLCDYVGCYGQEAIAGVNFVALAVTNGNDGREAAHDGPAVVGRLTNAIPEGLTMPVVAMRDSVRGYAAEELDPVDPEIIVAYQSGVPSFVTGAMIESFSVDHADALRSLTVPVLLTYGLEDRVIGPAAGERALGFCTTARASFYEGVGHSPFFEDPRRFNLELADFATRSNRGRRRNRSASTTVARHVAETRVQPDGVVARDLNPGSDGGSALP